MNTSLIDIYKIEEIINKIAMYIIYMKNRDNNCKLIIAIIAINTSI